MQMSIRAITGIISFCVSFSGVILANLFVTMMIGEINRKREEGKLVSYFGFTFPKVVLVFHEYRRSYPRGNLHIYALVAFAVGMIGLSVVIVCLHIIG